MLDFFWILQNILLSITIVFLIHHIISYLRDTLTVPKIKDMVNLPTKQYEDMYQIIQQQKKEQDNLNHSENKKQHSSIEDSTNKTDNSSDMKNELKNYLKKQMNQAEDPHSFSFSDINSLPISDIN